MHEPLPLWKKLNLLAILIALACSVWERSHSCRSSCSSCGLAQRIRTWRLPFTGSTVWQSDRREETAVSLALRESGAVGTHEHRWRLARGEG